MPGTTPGTSAAAPSRRLEISHEEWLAELNRLECGRDTQDGVTISELMKAKGLDPRSDSHRRAMRAIMQRGIDSGEIVLLPQMKVTRGIDGRAARVAAYCMKRS